jgi:hypothetical protein
MGGDVKSEILAHHGQSVDTDVAHSLLFWIVTRSMDLRCSFKLSPTKSPMLNVSSRYKSGPFLSTPATLNVLFAVSDHLAFSVCVIFFAKEISSTG